MLKRFLVKTTTTTTTTKEGLHVKMEKMLRNLKLKHSIISWSVFPNPKSSGKYSLTLSNNPRLVQFKTSSSYTNQYSQLLL